MRIPKIACFYVSKNGKVYDNQAIVTEAIQVTGNIVKCAVGITVAKNSLPLLIDIVNSYSSSGIVVQATPLISTPSVMDGMQTVVLTTTSSSGIKEGLAPLIRLLQDLAEPFALGFAIKGVLYKMSGKEKEGDIILKNAIIGFLVIQFLPQLFRILGGIQLG